MSEDSATAVAAGAPATGPAPGPACQNCGAALLGAHCYACGQPVKGLVRHFSSILGDFMDTVFNIDSRVFRTLGPLFARPGFLSRQYFEGHRVRYVSPVRLFFFITLVTFFLARFALDFGDVNINGSDGDDIAAATTVAEVEQRRDAALAGLAEGRNDLEDAPPGVDGALVAAEAVVRSTAEARIRELREAEARGAPPPRPTHDGLRFNERPWDAKTNPVVVDGLPGFANDWLNAQIGRANANIARFKEDKDLLKEAILGAVPSTLFVLMPVFALMLKVAYLFRRRLYMEHLIVALHSHAFLCLALLGVMLLTAAEGRLAPADGALKAGFDLAEAALWTWMPLYLLLMQKRVYAQGWPMTLLKFFVLGISYTVLLSFGAAFTVLAGVVWA